MNAKTLFALAALVVDLPFVYAAGPYPLTIPDGEYRLVPACRFQRVQTPMIGQVYPCTMYAYRAGGFVPSVFFGGVWSPELVFSPGEGGVLTVSGGSDTFLFQQSAATVLPLALAPGFNLVCCQTDTTAGFEDIVGRAPKNGEMVYQFNAGPGRNPFNLAAPDYTVYPFTNGTWSPSTPVAAITEAVFVYEPPELTVARAGDRLVVLDWLTNVPNCVLESTTNPVSGVWTTNLSAPVVVNGHNRVTNSASGTQLFFRLVH